MYGFVGLKSEQMIFQKNKELDNAFQCLFHCGRQEQA